MSLRVILFMIFCVLCFIYNTSCTGLRPGYVSYNSPRDAYVDQRKQKAACDAKGGVLEVSISDPGFLSGGAQGFKYVCKKGAAQ